MIKKIVLLFVSVLVLLLAVFIFKNKIAENKKENIPIAIQQENKVSFEDNKTNELKSIQAIDELEKKIDENEIKNVEQKVPFVVQAPMANWNDPVFQNGCEEASIIMAMGWTKGIGEISPKQAFEQINDIVKFENKTFGFNEDANLRDIERIFQEKFKYSKVAIYENIKLEDVINEIQKGNIVLVPAFGQALKNPNFTQPGPIAHMLVVIGYDKDKKQFITNDPGTKRGKGFRYEEKVLFDAIWRYPNGKGPLEIPKKDKITKGIVVVGK